MRNTLAVLFLTLLLTGPLRAARIIVQLTVDQPTVTEFSLAIRQDEKADFRTTYRYRLNAEGRSTFELNLPFDQLVILTYGNETAPLYLSTTDSPEMTFTADLLRQTLRFGGAGAAKNNVLNDYFRRFGSGLTRSVEIGYLQSEQPVETARLARADAASYYAAQRERLAEKRAYLQQHGTGLPAGARTYLEREVEYGSAVERMGYLLLNESLPAAETATLKRTYRPLDGVRVDNGAATTHPTYLNFLKAWAQYEALPALAHPKTEASEMYAATATLRSEAKAYLQSQLLVRYYDRTNRSDFGVERFPALAAAFPNSPYTQVVRDAYGLELSLVGVETAPAFRMTTTDGRTVNLSDYRGRVVYISFWASWCKPCLAGFEKSVALRGDLERMGVVLLNVSIDETEAAFRGALERQPIIGVNSLAQDLDTVKRDYNLYSIPAYFILDKRGQFAYLSGGDNRDIREEFRKLVRAN